MNILANPATSVSGIRRCRKTESLVLISEAKQQNKNCIGSLKELTEGEKHSKLNSENLMT